MDIREYEDDDLDDVRRIWQECGWVDEEEAEHLEDFLVDAHTKVADLDGEVEAATSVHDGTIDHTGTPLPLAAVTAVVTSRVGRRQGLARATLDAALRSATKRGMVVAALGIFDQGFYDQSGFGTGAEMLMFRVDPAHLPSDLPYRRPVRLTLDDMADIVDALVARDTVHGAVTLPSVPMRRAEHSWGDNGFGLGYRDADGTLTHFIWCNAKAEEGPYEVREWAWRTPHELRELLGLLRSLSDQVRTVVVPEPAQAQLRVLIDRPGRMRITRTQGEHRYEVRASAWWQARILDVPRCLAALSAVRELHCNLHVLDPLDLPAVAGEWTVHLGARSSAVRGHEMDLPTLTLSVNALTRLWLGVRPATTLATTDHIEAERELLEALDDAVRLPRPDISMDF